MKRLVRGANAPLTGGRTDVRVGGARQGSVDLMVFQLGPDRLVRSDRDFVFFNQPTSPEGAVRLAEPDQVVVDLGSLPAGIQTLAVAVALDDSVPGSLAGLGLTGGLTGGLTVSVADRPTLGPRVDGPEFEIDLAGLTTERAAVLVEIYRRADAWKIRNVSAGWTEGLAALVREHGVSVDEAPPGGPSGETSGEKSDPAPAEPAPARVAAGVVDRPALPAPDSFPRPGGFLPPGGSLPPPPFTAVPRPGGWTPPGGPPR